jgi:hypothetical protein
MKRFMLVLICGASLALGESAPAQTCAELPFCPDDGAQPIGEFLPACSCPRPSSCGDFPDFQYSCGFDSFFFQWSCTCTDLREPIQPPPHTAPEEHDFCSDFVCPDGSRAFGGEPGQGCLCRASVVVPFERKLDRHCRIPGSASGNLKYSQSSRRMIERLVRGSQYRLASVSVGISGRQCDVLR